MNSLSKIIAGSILGTVAMTIFSYAVTHSKRRQFKEPVILGALVGDAKALTRLAGGNTVVLGWLMHYLAGLSFTACYSWYWENTRTDPTVGSGFLLGGANGIAGILIWRMIFLLHPDPPKIKIANYLSHLIIAHLIFGVFVAIGYRVPAQKLSTKFSTSVHNSLLANKFYD